MNDRNKSFVEQFAPKIALTFGMFIFSWMGSSLARAATFTEVGDAGVLPSLGWSSFSAQTVELMPGETLDAIAGSFNGSSPWSDIDMFKITLSEGLFSARTHDGIEAGTRWLFLFNADGLGVAANQGNGIEAALEGEISTSGDYFLGIGSGRNYQWSSGSGSIFTADDYASTTFGARGAGVSFRPNGVGRSGPVDIGDGYYTIAISQTSTTVPEPMMILGLSVLGVLGARTIRKGQC